MTIRKEVTRVPEGLEFYFATVVDSTCFKSVGSSGGDPFDLSTAYLVSYHPMTEILLYYDDNDFYLRGLEVMKILMTLMMVIIRFLLEPVFPGLFLMDAVYFTLFFAYSRI